MTNHGKSFRSLLLVSIIVFTSCERETELVIKGSDPPTFVLSGSGSLGTIRIRGPEKQREAQGEDAFLYWVTVNLEDEEAPVERLGPVTYGEVPQGYKQVYPEIGQAPPLVEGARYNIRIATFNAPGVDKFFLIRDGNVELLD